jgi:hypothetical protein
MLFDDVHQFVLTMPDYLGKLGFTFLGQKRVARHLLEIAGDMVFFEIFYRNRGSFRLDQFLFLLRFGFNP